MTCPQFATRDGYGVELDDNLMGKAKDKLKSITAQSISKVFACPCSVAACRVYISDLSSLLSRVCRWQRPKGESSGANNAPCLN